MKKLLMTTAAVLCAGTISAATHNDMNMNMSENNYARFDAGWAIGRGSIDDAGVFALGMGHQFTDYMKAELLAEYRPFSKFKKGGADNDFYSLDAMANVYLMYPVMERVHIYGMGGIGYAYNKVDGHENFKGDGRSDFAWNIGAGMTYDINDCWAMDVGYRYVDLGQARAKDRTTGASISEDVQYNDIRLSLIYQF